MYYLIDGDRSVVGTTDIFEDSAGFAVKLAEDGLSALPGDCYFDPGADLVRAKPTAPSPLHFWDSEALEWVAWWLPEGDQAEDWDGLLEDLRGSAAFEKAYGAAERTLKANAAFTMLLAALTSTKSAAGLLDAIARLREAMAGIAAIGDFSAEEVQWINSRLERHHFEVRIFEIRITE